MANDNEEHDDEGGGGGDGKAKGSLGGKIKEKLGWLTADRLMEGEGRVQQAESAGLTGDEEDGDGAAVADKAELEVRADYDEVHPDAEPG